VDVTSVGHASAQVDSRHHRNEERESLWLVLTIGLVATAFVCLAIPSTLQIEIGRRWILLEGFIAVSGLLLTSLLFWIVRAHIRARAAAEHLARELRSSQDRYRAFIANSSEAIWCYELSEPVQTDLPEEEQIELFYRRGRLTECNQAMALMYGYTSPDGMVGLKLEQILPRSKPENIEFLRAFIRSGYRLNDAESHDVDAGGNTLVALNNLIGVVENGCGIRAWGTNRNITARHLAEQQLRDNEARKSAIMESALDCVITMDHLGRIVEFNPAAERTFGWKREEVVGRTVAETIVPPHLREVHARGLERFLKTGNAFVIGHRVEMPAMRADGSLFPAELAISSTKLNNDAPFFTAYLRDISERIDAEEALRKSEEQYRTLVEQVKDFAIFMIDPEGRATSWNEGVKRLLGYNEDEFLHRHITSIFTPEDVASGVPQRELDDAARTGRSSDDRWMMRKDGRRFWASGLTTVLRSGSGALIGYTKVMRDLTDRRRAEEELRKSEANLAAAQRLAQIGSWELELRDLYEMTDNPLRWSEEVYRIFGYEPGEIQPSNDAFFEAVHPDDRQQIHDAMRLAIDNRTDYSIEHRIRWPDGTERIVHERAEVVCDQTGRPLRMLGTLQDITERKEAEHELTRHRDHLEQLVAERTRDLQVSHERFRLTERMAALGTLSAGLGHDMGNLLLPIRARLDVLQSRIPPGEIDENIQTIRMATDYLQRLANGLRLLAMDTDRPSASEASNLRQWWLDAAPILKNALPRGVMLEVNLAPDVPPVRLARHHLMQVIFNLVQNAGDALKSRGRGHVTVWAAHELRSPVVRLGVTDDGPGMTAEVKRRCLEPFFTTKTRSISTGLGLALVHGIARTTGCDIEIESEPGQGATFVLSIPVAASPVTLGGGAAASSREEGRPMAIVTLQDPRMRSYVASLLSSLSFEVIWGKSATNPDARLWVTDDPTDLPDAASQFLQLNGDRRVVILGGSMEPAHREGYERDHLIVLPEDSKLSTIRKTLEAVANDLAASPTRNGP
jgi:PAS domain S-box-containing protein